MGSIRLKPIEVYLVGTMGHFGEFKEKNEWLLHMQILSNMLVGCFQERHEKSFSQYRNILETSAHMDSL